MKNEVQEIDLLELFLKGFLFVKTNIKFLFIFALAGTILGISYYYFKPQRFTQEITGYSTTIEPEILKESFNKFSNSLYIDELQNQSEDESVVRSLQSITEVEIQDINAENAHLIKIIFTSAKELSGSIFSELIETNLSDNPYITRRIANKKANLESIISFIDTEIQNIQQRNNNNKTSGTILLNNEETPTSLYIQKKEYEEDLNNIQPFIIAGISKPQESGVSLLTLLFGGAFLGLFIALSINILKALNRITKNIEYKSPGLFLYNKTA